MDASQNYNVNLNINANTQSAQQQLQNLQKQLMQIANMKVNVQGTDALASNITEASQAALKLSSILNASTNMQTGNLDYIKFSNALKKGNIDIIKYGQSLQELGPAGQKAFVGLAQTIAKSEIPIKRTSQLTQKMWNGFKRTAGWQLQSSIIHGVVGGVQKAVGYAKDLNKSLTDIRIVTGQSSDQMAKFAQQANKAAKQLNTTTTEYTKASLIYYQQGLSDADVKARTETTIKMANVTGTSAQKVSDQMTAIWNNYDNGTKSLTHYADVMTALGAATASSTDEIAQGLQKFASISNTVGLSYEYAASALATITAESRESADVVGNALKTLFSRIQGLQLGETLDDGTTLNKYSTALAKVGISIKDQTGGLKDMDDILDEMGTKWDTLARDEKMALAQTVAGVRQYTQLMTLMENWDDFKKNLNTANTSTGTLDSQAAIYAESWDAASKRVRTSFEKLWDKLINSDSFITALDLLSGFVDVLSSLVDGMGGATGVFTTFAGAFTKIFSPQIAQGLSNFGYGIKMMIPGVRQAYEQKRAQELDTFKASLKSGHMEGVGTEESKTYSSIVDRQVHGARQYLQVQDQLSPEQRYAYEHYSKLLDENDAQRLANSQQQDQNAHNIGNIFDRIYSGKRESKINDPNYGLNANYKSIDSKGRVIDSGKTRRDYFSEKAEIHGSRLDAARQLTSLKGDEFDKFLGQFSDTNQKNIKKRIAGWRDNEKLTEDAILKRLPEYISEINDKSMKRASSSMVLTDDEQKDMPDAEAQQQYKQNYEDYGKEKSKSEPLKQQGERLKTKGEQIFTERGKVAQPEKKLSTAQKMVSLASGLTSTVATISSLEGLSDQIKALGDGAGDATAILGSVVSVASNGLMAFSSLSQVMGGPYAAALMAVTALTTMAIKAYDKNNINEKERIKTLQQSDDEIKNATSNTKQLIETYETQNNNYLESVEKIKTSSKPEEIVNDIFYANQQALKLIKDYGLTNEQYKRNNAGLIEIDKQILEDKVTAAEKANQDMERTSALSNLTTQRELAEIRINNLLDDTGYIDYNGSQVTTHLFGTNKDSDSYVSAAEAWSFDELMSIYGTEEWDKAEETAKVLGKKTAFKEMEEQILAYQEANNLLDLGVKNNVDSLLRAQEYTLDGAESFAALGYEDYNQKYNQTYENGKFSGTNFNSSNFTDTHKNRIKEYLESQGYTGVEDDIEFDGESKFTFKHDEGEGSVNVEAVRKWDAEQTAADEVELTFDASMGVLQTLYKSKGSDVAPGLMSLLTGDNFINTTIEEMEAAKTAVSQINEDLYNTLYDGVNEDGTAKLREGLTGTDSDIDEFIKKNFGLDTKAFKELFNIGDDVNLVDWFKTFENYTSKAQRLISGEPLLDQWLNGEDKEHNGFGNKIKENLNQGTLVSLYDSFKQASLLGGTDAGQAMIDGITEVLEKSNLDESDWDQAVQGLLAIDWSNILTSGGAAASVISNLGGELDTTTNAWKAFAEAMAAAAGAMPDFSGIISQLTQLAGALQGLSKGGTVSADIRDQLVAMNPEFADLFSKHFSGDYTFIGDDNKILSDAIWDQMNDTKTDASAIQKRYDDYMSNGGKEQKDNDSITADDFSMYKVPGGPWITRGHASQLGQIAGYDSYTQANILTNYNQAEANLNSWKTDTGVQTERGMARIVTDDNGNQVYQLQDDNGKWRNANDAEIIDLGEEYSTDQTEYSAAKAAKDTMLDSIHGLDEVSGEWKPEEIEQAISTASSLSDVIGRVREGQAGLVEENGNLSESTVKGIEAWAAQNEVSERTQAAIDSLITAEEYLQEVRENGGDVKSAEDIRDEALAYTELQATIDEVAAARGLDAETVATQAEAIREALSAAGVSAEDIANAAADAVEAQEALDKLNESADDYRTLASKVRAANGQLTDPKYTKDLNTMATLFTKIAGAQDLGIKSTQKLNSTFQKFLNDTPNAVEDFLNGSGDALKKWAAQAAQIKADEILGTDFTDTVGDSLDTVGDLMAEYSDTIDGMAIGDSLTDSFAGGAEAAKNMTKAYATAVQDMMTAGADMDTATDIMANATNFTMVPFEGNTNTLQSVPWLQQEVDGQMVFGVPDVTTTTEKGDTTTESSSSMKFFKLVKTGDGGGSRGGGGGGGGGPKEPKKVANKRKSQTVKRYKRNDVKRESASKSKDAAENKKDYLYGESKIAQMEKINKLAEKEAKITADRIKESRKYLVEDRENLIKYMQKYGFEAEFDTDGFLANYEEAWTKIYEEIAALYEDNLLTEDEEKIEEDLNVKLEELEGTLEDYENSLSELADDIEKYKESLYEMYDNKVEALQHKVEFKIELDEDNLEYLNFWIETLGDNVYNTIFAIEAMGTKANALFSGLETYQQGIADIYALSNDPLQIWATGGLENVLTQDQVDALRENRDGLIDYMQQLVDLREEIKDKVLDTFDAWQEKIDANITSLEHYTSVIEHFKSIIDIVGKDPFGLSDQFMNKLEQNAIDQSVDSIEANKAYYESLVEQQSIAQEKLDEARARGDQSSIEHWEEVVRTTTEAVESAQDALLTSLEDTLTMIAEQFETTMQRAIDAFNDAIYKHGGLEGLSSDYSMMRENADLMAADYEKIYELSKLSRNINKTLDDTSIIYGKQKLTALLKEVNDLQASGVELSKYDLEYLQAKYDLRLAEIELENAKNAKDTVRLSRDNEGNWSYVYTQSVDAVEEAEQKYEDALYKMQTLSQKYLEEMSSSMVDTSSAMMEEISALRIQDFTSYEAYQNEVKRIQDKYAETLKLQEDELNKAVKNSSDLYKQDWQNYNLLTDYKISATEDWVDSFRESALGELLDSDTVMSAYSDIFLGLTDQMSQSLAEAAIQYFVNIDEAMNKYGTSAKNFGNTVISTIGDISGKSKKATSDIKNTAAEMKDAFKEIADVVSDWQEKFNSQIDDMLEKIKTLVQEINESIRLSAQMTGNKTDAGNLIGTKEAIELLNTRPNGVDLGTFSLGSNGQIIANGETYENWIAYNGKFIEAIDAKLAEYSNAHTGSKEREQLGEELKELFKRYHAFKDVVSRIYDMTSGSTINLDTPNYSSFDTGGYTGEWGESGKFAMLHEKELILNANDTKNFLDALNISRQIINSMIEMNARQSSLAFGDLMPNTVQDMFQTLEQQVSITAEFPNATEHNEIEEAFNNLINTASQYANRFRT